MTPCRAYLKLRWRYIGPLLCLCWAPHDAMLAPCWAHVTLMLTHFPHRTKFCRSSKTMEKHSILEQKWGPPPPQIPIWNSIGPLLGLSWAFVQRIFTYVGSMLALYNAMSGPPGGHRTLCQDHVRPMLDPKYALKSVSNKTCFWYGLWPPWKLPYDTLSSLS